MDDVTPPRLSDRERIAVRRAICGELAELGMDWASAERDSHALAAEILDADDEGALRRYVDTRLAVHRETLITRLQRRIEQARASVDERQAELFPGEAP